MADREQRVLDKALCGFCERGIPIKILGDVPYHFPNDQSNVGACHAVGRLRMNVERAIHQAEQRSAAKMQWACIRAADREASLRNISAEARNTSREIIRRVRSLSLDNGTNALEEHDRYLRGWILVCAEGNHNTTLHSLPFAECQEKVCFEARRLSGADSLSGMLEEVKREAAQDMQMDMPCGHTRAEQFSEGEQPPEGTYCRACDKQRIAMQAERRRVVEELCAPLDGECPFCGTAMPNMLGTTVHTEGCRANQFKLDKGGDAK